MMNLAHAALIHLAVLTGESESGWLQRIALIDKADARGRRRLKCAPVVRQSDTTPAGFSRTQAD